MNGGESVLKNIVNLCNTDKREEPFTAHCFTKKGTIGLKKGKIPHILFSTFSGTNKENRHSTLLSGVY